MKQIIIWLIKNTVLYYDKTDYNLKHNLTGVFVQILADYFIDQNMSYTIRSDAMDGLYNLIKTKDNAIYTIAQYKGLYQALIRVVESKDQKLKHWAWSILSQFVTVKYPFIGSEMIKFGILDTITKSLKAYPNSIYRPTIEKLILKIIQNSPSDFDKLINSPVL